MRYLSVLMVCSLILWWPPVKAAKDPLGLQQALGVQSTTGLNRPKPHRRSRAGSPQPVAVTPVRKEDVGANRKSNVFGTRLFTGAFVHPGAAQFNPDYRLAVGDRIQLRLWGGQEFDAEIEVDPKGNVFIPQVGPVKVLGVRNKHLQKVIRRAVRKVFKANVYSYANLVAAQPVRVFVGGFVRRPGLYPGTSMDSVLFFLDQAGGIDPDRGSFIDVQVKRGGRIRHRFSLYDFLLDGDIPFVQLAAGDVIFIPARKHTVQADGLVENANRFEFESSTLKLAALMRMAKPKPEATHVRVIRNRGPVRNVEYYSLDAKLAVTLQDGDEVRFTADKKPGTLTVRVEGEHLSAQEYVLPHGARFGDLIHRIKLSPDSDIANIQLFRTSVRERQKAMLDTSLKQLEAAVLTARSGTAAEAQLRKEEADNVLQWIDRAKQIQPKGQVYIASAPDLDRLLLENGDIIHIPAKDGLIVVGGEVLFPTAVAYNHDYDVFDYIHKAGGFTQNADSSRVLLVHRDGSSEEVKEDNADPFGLARNPVPRRGDQILILPKVDVKSRQIAMELTQILYQIAVSARVALGL